MRTTCEKCRGRFPLFVIRVRRADKVRVLRPAARVTQDKRRTMYCEPCGCREIDKRNRLDSMSPGAVGFVLANGGRL